MENNYLICNKCLHKNVITSERVVFCSGCKKKISHNFLDWKKENAGGIFENYLLSIKIYNQNILSSMPVIKEKKPYVLPDFSLKNLSPKTKIFFGAFLLQLFLMLAFLQPEAQTNTENTISYNNQTSITSDNTNQNNQTDYASQISDVNSPCQKTAAWNQFSISNDLSIALPFNIENSESVLPEYMKSHISNHKSKRSEACRTFSVTIEKMNFTSLLSVPKTDLCDVKDEYMTSPGVVIVKDETMHTKVSGYETIAENGNYIMNGQEYLYENYTLIKGNECVKVVLSYLKNDHTLCKYADIVTQSLLNSSKI